MKNASKLPKVARRQEEAIARVVEEVRKDPARAWTAAELASVAHYEAIYFALLCRKLVGLSPVQLRMKTRMSEAKKLLEQTTLTIGEIASRVGYANVKTFDQAFRKNFGIKPMEHRDRSRLKEAARLLRETTFTIPDIRSQVGYSDASSFCRRFAQVYGLTPSKYRAKWST